MRSRGDCWGGIGCWGWREVWGPGGVGPGPAGRAPGWRPGHGGGPPARPVGGALSFRPAGGLLRLWSSGDLPSFRPAGGPATLAEPRYPGGGAGDPGDPTELSGPEGRPALARAG